jgi:hypothetical protein
MTTKLVNKVFSAKSTQYMRLERHKEPYNAAIWTHKRGMWQLESDNRHPQDALRVINKEA